MKPDTDSMELSISCRNFELTPAIKNGIEENVERLNSVLSGKKRLRWVCWSEKKTYFSEIFIQDQGLSFYALAHSDNLYKTFFQLVQKIKKQLKKRKEMIKERIHHQHSNHQLSTWQYHGLETASEFPISPYLS